MGLALYKSKRDFSKTKEPTGATSAVATRRNAKAAHKFIIQKHAASRLHYDFRLEMNGVLVSWAVPKGFPTEKGDKRLAIHVEDHPVEYGKFEGTIPAGNYGAGTVMLWDRGTYEVETGDATEALRNGKLIVRLNGRKLKGQWTLVQMKNQDTPKDGAWLMIKTGESVKSISQRQEDMSVASGKTMKQIGLRSRSVWQSNRATRTTLIPRTTRGLLSKQSHRSRPMHTSAL